VAIPGLHDELEPFILSNSSKSIAHQASVHFQPPSPAHESHAGIPKSSSWQDHRGLINEGPSLLLRFPHPLLGKGSVGERFGCQRA